MDLLAQSTYRHVRTDLLFVIRQYGSPPKASGVYSSLSLALGQYSSLPGLANLAIDGLASLQQAPESAVPTRATSAVGRRSPCALQDRPPMNFCVATDATGAPGNDANTTCSASWAAPLCISVVCLWELLPLHSSISLEPRSAGRC